MSRMTDEINAIVKQAQVRVAQPRRGSEKINRVNRVRNFGQVGFNNVPGVYDSLPQELVDDADRLNRNTIGSVATSAAEMADINDAVRRSNPRINMQLNNAPYKHGVRPGAVGYSQNRQAVPHNHVGGVQVVREQREGDRAAPKDTVQADPNNQWLTAERNNGSGQSWTDYSNDWWNKRFKEKEEAARRREAARKAQQAPQPVQQPAPQPARQPARRTIRRTVQRPAPKPPMAAPAATTPKPAPQPRQLNVTDNWDNPEAFNQPLPASEAAPKPPAAASAAKPAAKPAATPATVSATAAPRVSASSQQGNWGDWASMMPLWSAFASMGNGGGFNPMGMMMLPMLMNGGMFGQRAGGAYGTPSPSDIASASAV